MFRSAAIVAIVLALLLSACAEPRAPFGIVSGNARYGQQVTLPADAMLEVRIYDMSEGDEDGRLVAQQAIRSPEQRPVPFQIRYDPRVIDPSHSYVIRARFKDGETPLLETLDPYPILTHGHPHRAELVLEQAGRSVVRPMAPRAAQPAPEPDALPTAELDVRPMAEPDVQPTADLELPATTELDARPRASARSPVLQPSAPIELIPGLGEEAAH